MTIKFDELLEALDPSLDKLDDKSTKLKEAWEAEFESAYDDLMNDDSLSEKEKDEALKQLFAQFGFNESLNESINQDIKLINKELERNNREVSKIGFKTHPFFNDGEIAVYVPNERHANLVKSIVRDVARKYGCDSVVEDDNYKGSILFSFHKNDSYRNIGREESERAKQMFENVIKKYNIDYDTALAFILDKIDKDELEFIISELIKMNNK